MEAESKSYPKELVRLSTGRPVDELLRELYVDKRHTQGEIATALGVSRSLVKDWLQEYGISREDRPPLEPLVPLS